MRRSAVSLAVIAILLAPMHALGALGIGCDGVRAEDSCCCPTSAGAPSEQDDREQGPNLAGTCCCDIQPVSQTSPVPPAGMSSGDAPLSTAATEHVVQAPAPSHARPARAPASARGPPATAGSLLDQHIALLV